MAVVGLELLDDEFREIYYTDIYANYDAPEIVAIFQDLTIIVHGILCSLIGAYLHDRFSGRPVEDKEERARLMDQVCELCDELDEARGTIVSIKALFRDENKGVSDDGPRRLNQYERAVEMLEREPDAALELIRLSKKYS